MPRTRLETWRGRPLCALVTALAVVLAACEAPVAEQEPPPHRPSDGLLNDPDLQELVALQIRRDGEALVARLSDSRPEVRARAAYALGSVQSAEAVPSLVDALEDEDPAVRRDAAFALGQSGVPEVAEDLLARLDSEDDSAARAALIEAVSKLPSSAASAGLARLSVRPQEGPLVALGLARMAAVGGILVPEALDRLLDGLESQDPGVRWGSAYFFGRLAQAGPWKDRASRVRRALDAYDPTDPAARQLIAALGHLQDPADTPTLTAWAVRAKDWRTRTNVMVALQHRDLDEEAQAVVFEALDDASIHVAQMAAVALAGTRPTLSSLHRMERWIDAHPERIPAIRPLVSFLAGMDEREYVFAWLDALTPEDEERWDVGLGALASMTGGDALTRLERATSVSSSTIAAAATSALAQRWRRERSRTGVRPRYFRTFTEAVRSGDPPRVWAAAPALADSAFLDMGNVDVLLSEYAAQAQAPPQPNRIRAMEVILQALSGTGDARAEALARTVLGGTDGQLRRAARRALTRITGTEVEVGQDAVGKGVGPGADIAEFGFDPAAIDWTYLRELGPAPRLVLETERGRVILQLATEDAPQTVQAVARMANQGRYDDTPFHRVVPNFVVQGGDVAHRDGSGGPGFSILSELTGIPFRRGVLGMASAGKDTEGSQFFVNHTRTPHLDGRYTAFGWVVEGLDVLDRIRQGDSLIGARVVPTP